MATTLSSEPVISASQDPAPAGRLEARYEQLDGLRGMAALVVFLFHAIMMMPPDEPALSILNLPFVRPLWDGPSAVMLFFVLSGFVLTLPYTGPIARKIEPLPFLVSRMTRLYPAYWAALAVAVALRIFVFRAHGIAGLSPWTNTHWRLPIGSISILRQASMIWPGLKVDELDPVIWSLIIEMKVSLIFPLVLLVVTRTTRLLWGSMVIAGMVFVTVPLHFMAHTSSSWLRAVIMLPVFLMGSYAAVYRKRLLSGLAARWARIAAAAAGIFLYSLIWFAPLGGQPPAPLTAAFGSSAFILLFLASPRLRRLGTARPIRLLGELSYSFYLVHLPVLIAVASVLYPRVHSVLLVAGLSLICSLATAWVIHLTVEGPGHTWGRRVARSLSAFPVHAVSPEAAGAGRVSAG